MADFRVAFLHMPLQVARAHEALRAQSATVLVFFRVLRNHVLAEIAGVREARVAVVTLERPLAGVQSLVSDQVALLYEGLVAERTLVRPFAGVDSQVRVQIAGVPERHFARLALERLHHFVFHADVAGERRRALVSAVANRTSEGLQVRVRLHVLLHTGFLGEGLAALQALVRLLVRVYPHVLLGDDLCLQRAMTERTGEAIREHLHDRVLALDVLDELAFAVEQLRANGAFHRCVPVQVFFDFNIHIVDVTQVRFVRDILQDFHLDRRTSFR